MKALDKQAWEAAYNSEYLGFEVLEGFKVVKSKQGVRILATLTRLEFREDHVEFLKCKPLQGASERKRGSANS